MNELFRLAAHAANLQQDLSYWLQREPGAAADAGHVRSARPALAARSVPLDNRPRIRVGDFPQISSPIVACFLFNRQRISGDAIDKY